MSSTSSLYILYLSTGFTVGFGHCIGMCGPIVVSLAFNLREKKIIVPQLLYHYGRITTYAVLGGVMGATGSFTVVAANMASIQKTIMIFTGLLVVVMGLVNGGWLPVGKFIANQYNPSGFISKGMHTLSGMKSGFIYYPMGLLLGLLPCGPVYAALIGAARAGMDADNIYRGILSGMGLMAAFGLGTVPALLLAAKLANLITVKSRLILFRIGSVLMIIAGVFFIINALRY